jgi:DNA mismatch repair protein MutS2
VSAAGEDEDGQGVRVTGVTSTPSVLPGPADAETLEQLEFDRALEEVARRAAGPLGAARVRARRPSADAPAVTVELRAVAELQGLLAGGDGFRPEPVEDITALLERLGIAGTLLDGIELAGLGRALEAMRLVRAELTRLAESAPLTAALAAEPPPARLGRDLLRIFDADGTVRDGTDDTVDRARHRVRDARARLIQTLERTLRALASHEVPPDPGVTVRGGRYVIPVLRDARGRVPGIVHGESGSGATLFVEPHAAVELGNALAAAEAAEARAVLALLRRLTDGLRPHVAAAAAAFEMCVAVDDRYARARYAADVGAALPRVGAAPGAHRLVGARHPLLLAEGVDAVPFDLDLDPSELALVVSGPNTGGKTVLLKAVGLINALAQAGVLPPVGEDTALPVYGAIQADIGDRQSIAASLSTFSAHLAALKRALEVASPAALVLLDEMGAGTDPIEGAALAAAALEALVARGARVVATTHLSALKQLAAETPGIVNASLQFDAATLTPTYRLAKGVPGRSYGLVIARRLGLPADLVADAERRTPEADRSLDAVLADVERRASEVQARTTELDTLAARLRRSEGELAVRQQAMVSREAEVATRAADLEKEGRQQARRFLLEARNRVEEALRMARAAVSEATAKEARRLVEEGISDEAAALRRLHDDLAKKGWRVKSGSGEWGVVPSQTLRPSGAARRAPERRPSSEGTTPHSPLPVSEVDLRGMTVDEAKDAVDRALDAAVLADLPSVRIIHGKGTGVLRAAVDELLRGDRRIASHRLAPPREGGTGVTIAELAG